MEKKTKKKIRKCSRDQALKSAKSKQKNKMTKTTQSILTGNFNRIKQINLGCKVKSKLNRSRIK